ncbi:hypothetical protein FRC09_019030, partial [Ceratobasidium sp. 395]
MKLEMTDIDRLVALYLALQPIPTSLIDSLASSQNEIIAQLLRNPHLDAYPPTPEYQRRIWKRIVTTLEERDVEVDDEMYSHLIELMNIPPRPGAPAASYLTYLLPCDPAPDSLVWRNLPRLDTFRRDRRPIAILESRTWIERGTTGLRTWSASLDLAEWVSENSHLVCSAHVLELGSGVGLLGLTIAALQQPSQASLASDDARDGTPKRMPCVFMTDVDEEVLARCTANLHLPCNMSDVQYAQVRALDWADSVDPTRAA